MVMFFYFFVLNIYLKTKVDSTDRVAFTENLENKNETESKV